MVEHRYLSLVIGERKREPNLFRTLDYAAFANLTLYPYLAYPFGTRGLGYGQEIGGRLAGARNDQVSDRKADTQPAQGKLYSLTHQRNGLALFGRALDAAKPLSTNDIGVTSPEGLMRPV